MNFQNNFMQSNLHRRIGLIILLSGSLLLLTWNAVFGAQPETPDAPLIVNSDFEFEASYNLGAGGGFGQDLVVTTTQQLVVFSIDVTGAEDISVILRDPASTAIWNETIASGEKAWGTALLLTGTNSIEFANGGGGSSSFTVKLEAILPAPTAFDGTSTATGINSVAGAQFTNSGFYTTTMTVNGGQQYTINMGDIFTQIVTETVTRVDYFPVSTQTFTITQDIGGGSVNWTVNFELESTSTALPYQLSESISADTSKVIPLDLPTSVNVSLSAAGPGASVAFEAKDEAGSPITNSVMTVPNGDTIWTTIDLPAGANQLLITPTGSIDYDLLIQPLPSGSANFDGDNSAGSQNSIMRHNFLIAGLYRFDFDVTGGRFQTVITNTATGVENAVKTVEEDGTTFLYVPSGDHEIGIVEDSTLGANWEMTVSLAFAGDNLLPIFEEGGDIGANDFVKERISVQSSASITANLNISATGSVGDSIVVEILDGTDTVIKTVGPIFGSESTWSPIPLAAGTNYIQITADGGNTGTLAYAFTLDEPSALSNPGDRIDLQGNSLSGSFPPTYTLSTSSGLYRFDLGLNAGEYQLAIDDDEALKTVTAAGVITYYLATGEHVININHNGTTDWSLDITRTSLDNDPLPTSFAGTNLGGAVNPFTEEWIPFNPDLDADSWVNLVVTMTGGAADQASAEIWKGELIGASNPNVYGGETAWLATQISPPNRIHLDADGSATNPLDYELQVAEPLEVLVSDPVAWVGIATNNSNEHTVVFNAPYTGTYNISTTLDSGTAAVDLGPVGEVGTAIAQPIDQIDLGRGIHIITVTGSTLDPTSEWLIEMGVEEIISPTLTSLSPMTLTVGATVTAQLNGSNFVNPVITITNGSDSFGLSVLSHTPVMAEVQIPNIVPSGIYDILLTNADGKTAALSAGAVFVGPQISSISPATVEEGYNINITINGTNLFNPTAILRQGGTDIRLATVSSSAVSMVATVPGTVTLGTYDVLIQNGSLTADFSNTLTGAFEVSAAVTPQVDSVTPSSILIDQGDFLTISGSNFLTPTAFLIRDNITTTLNILSNTDSEITAIVPALLGAGTYDVRVQNGTPTAPYSNLLVGGFEVVVDADPTINQISPSRLQIGANMQITVTGNYYVTPTVHLIDSNSVELELTTLSASSTEIQAQVPSTISVGVYDVYVENSGGDRSLTETDGLIISEAFLFMPLSAEQFAPYPDLVVESYVGTGNTVSVTITNQGYREVSDEFWVDLYINPTAAPTSVNDTIDTLGSDGLVWLISGNALPLAPGESFVLTLSDSYYQPAESRFNGTLPENAAIYIQVDSANKANVTGGVLESHEVNGTTYNNIWSNQ
ncbi:MAG: IPT/TIG domain-containing protein [Chloroflexota bacterium]